MISVAVSRHHPSPAPAPGQEVGRGEERVLQRSLQMGTGWAGAGCWWLLELETNLREVGSLTITEEAPTRAFSWLHAN